VSGGASPAPRVLLGVSGGIAAYKAAELVRLLIDRGAAVRVLMTPAAQRFITPLTLSVLSKAPVVADLWDPASGAVDHIELARWGEVLAVAPATADVLAKMARGIGDEALSTYALAHRRAIVVAPAMNTWMWAHPATQENLKILRGRGAVVVEPESGDLACGDVGPGRMAPPSRIADAILGAARASRSLIGRRIVVTAGPTREPIDPVRFLTNRSSGRMGYSLAREAEKRGAEVVLVSGPVAIDPPPNVRLVKVDRTAEMLDAVLGELPSADALVMAAAPADFQAEVFTPKKIKRAGGVPEIRLALAPDILAAVRAVRTARQVVVAFAAETDDLAGNARQKLLDKGADLLVANDVSRPGIGFDSEENEVLLLAAGESDPVSIPRAAKAVVAAFILERLAALLDEKCPLETADPAAKTP
jgi:phosphopantothenoylcysteine decarboxylase/phosphopantothenate--cysteine ligase